jgi:hypothetical protein
MAHYRDAWLTLVTRPFGEKSMAKKVEKESSKDNAPVFSKRLGAVSATVFENQSEERVYFNVQITRRYKGGDGEWHDSNVLNGEADVTHLIQVLECTNRFLQERAMQSTDAE